MLWALQTKEGTVLLIPDPAPKYVNDMGFI
jgi:hypothetical protein